MTRVKTDNVVPVLEHLRSLGPGCAVRAGADTRDQRLIVACGHREAIGSRLSAAADSHGADERRVAASLTQYELAERLWAVSIAVWSQHRLVVDVSDLLAGPDTATWDLAAPATCGLRAEEDVVLAARGIARRVVGLLAVLHRTIRTHTSIAEGLLWGNAATAATLALHSNSTSGARSRARSLVSVLLSQIPLRGRLDGDVDDVLTRRSCCLYYRTRDPRPCPECPLGGSTVTLLAAGGRPAR